MHAWLSKKDSPMRGHLMILCGEGTFYIAHTAEKVASSAVLHKPMAQQEFQAGTLARARTVKPVGNAEYAVEDDCKGFFCCEEAKS